MPPGSSRKATRPDDKRLRTGRPMEIDQPVGIRDDGTTITVSERIVQLIQAGNYIETAANAVGLAKDTFHGWLRIGARTDRALLAGKLDPADVTPHQAECQKFLASVLAAQADAEARDVATLAQLARGGKVVKITTTKTDAAGAVTTTVREEVTQPDASVLQWRLERRFPDRWGRKSTVELTGADGSPIEVTIEERAERLARHAQLHLEAIALGPGDDDAPVEPVELDPAP